MPAKTRITNRSKIPPNIQKLVRGNHQLERRMAAPSTKINIRLSQEMD
jgi:hypothetical protein